MGRCGMMTDSVYGGKSETLSSWRQAGDVCVFEER